MTLEDREALLVHCMRLPSFLARAKEYLLDEHFSAADEHHLKVLWTVLCQQTARLYSDNAVPYVAVRKAVGDWYDDDNSVVKADEAAALLDTPQEVGEGDLTGLLWHAWHEAVEGRDYEREHGLELLRQFFQERAIHDPSAAAFTLPDDRIAANYDDELASWQKNVQRLSTLGSSPPATALPEEGEYRPIEVWHTDVDFLRTPMVGMAFPEIYGLMGPFGGGKSTMGLQIAVRTAELFMREHHELGKPLKHVFYFFYEGSQAEYWTRLWSLIGEVHKDRLLGVQSYDDARLTRTGDPVSKRLDYERALAKRNGVAIEKFPGEYDRILEGAAMIPNFHLKRMNGDAGSGYVDEISAFLDEWRQDKEWEPGLVSADYAGVAARRYCKAKGWDVDRNIRHLTYGFVDEMADKVNQKFGCCSWILHQLAGAVTGRVAGARMHHSEGSETKQFAENLDFCFLLGNRDGKTGMVRFDYSKCRRTDKTGMYGILNFRGEYARFESVDDYTIRNGEFVSNILAAQVGGELARKEPTLRRKRPDSEEGGAAAPFMRS